MAPGEGREGEGEKSGLVVMPREVIALERVGERDAASSSSSNGGGFR